MGKAKVGGSGRDPPTYGCEKGKGGREGHFDGGFGVDGCDAEESKTKVLTPHVKVEPDDGASPGPGRGESGGHDGKPEEGEECGCDEDGGDDMIPMRAEGGSDLVVSWKHTKGEGGCNNTQAAGAEAPYPEDPGGALDACVEDQGREDGDAARGIGVGGERELCVSSEKRRVGGKDKSTTCGPPCDPGGAAWGDEGGAGVREGKGSSRESGRGGSEGGEEGECCACADVEGEERG